MDTRDYVLYFCGKWRYGCWRSHQPYWISPDAVVFSTDAFLGKYPGLSAEILAVVSRWAEDHKNPKMRRRVVREGLLKFISSKDDDYVFVYSSFKRDDEVRALRGDHMTGISRGSLSVITDLFKTPNEIDND